MATEGPFLLSQPHPRTYGNFARLLGKYVRDEKVLALPDAAATPGLDPAHHWLGHGEGTAVFVLLLDQVNFPADFRSLDASAAWRNVPWPKPNRMASELAWKANPIVLASLSATSDT